MNPCTNQWQSASNHYVICVTLRCNLSLIALQLILENEEKSKLVQTD